MNDKSMKLSDLGEFGLIQKLAGRFSIHLPDGIEGIEDDCAVVPFNDELSLLLTTDLLLENIHFLKACIRPEELGHKALAVNLSDIAAMGGIPLYALMSLGIPADLEIEWLDRFLDGFDKLAKAENILLVGGDSTRSTSEIMINVALVGQIKTSHIKRRSSAIPGDVICCTGYLGLSGAGLKVLIKKLPLNELTTPLVYAHHKPQAHLRQGQWLASQPAVNAMMDISDGIDSDIRHIMEQSKCGAEIDLDKLPIDPLLQETAKHYQWNVKELAATAGEDYCLLLTVEAGQFQTVNALYQSTFGTPLFQIGRMTSTGELIYRENEEIVKMTKHGFDHFH